MKNIGLIDTDGIIENLALVHILDTIIENGGSHRQHLKSNLVPRPKSLLSTGVAELYPELGFKPMDMIDFRSKDEVAKYSLKREEVIQNIRHMMNLAYGPNAHFELAQAILESEVAEQLIFVASDTGVFTLTQLMIFIEQNEKNYIRLDPAAIVYTLFMSSEFQSTVPTQVFISSKEAYDMVVDTVVAPILQPFLSKRKKTEKLLNALLKYTIFSHAMMEISQLLVSSAITTERIVVFEHIAKFVDDNTKDMRLLYGDKLTDLKWFDTKFPKDLSDVHPHMINSFYGPMLLAKENGVKSK